MADAHPEQKHLLLIFSGINFIDMAGADFLAELVKREKKEGGKLYLYDIKAPVCEEIQQEGYLDLIGAKNIFESKDEALAEIFTRLDREICGRCRARIFLECLTLPPPVGP
jgi:SulP family sulfate permease